MSPLKPKHFENAHQFGRHIASMPREQYFTKHTVMLHKAYGLEHNSAASHKAMAENVNHIRHSEDYHKAFEHNGKHYRVRIESASTMARGAKGVPLVDKKGRDQGHAHYASLEEPI